MRKIYLPAKHFKSLFLLFSFLIFAFGANAGTYYLTNAARANAQLPASWNTIPAGGGTAAANFTTSGDIFIIPVGIAGTFASNTTATFSNVVSLQVDGSFTIGSGSNNAVTTVTINGTIIFSNTSSTQVTLPPGGNPNTTTTFTLGASATLKTANTNGILGTNCSLPVVSGKAVITPLPATANYEFNNATTAQVTLGLPATVNSLTINNAAGVNLTAAVTVSTLTIGNLTPSSIFNDNGKQVTSAAGGIFNLTSGTFNIGSGATATTYPAFAANNISSGTTVNYASTASQTIAAVNYGNLTNTGNGARTLASSGTIGIQNSFTPGSGAYTITNSTVQYDGSVPQIVSSGTSGFNYYNLVVTNSSANITLDNTGVIGIAGTFTPNATSFGTITNSTIAFNGSSGAQTIPQFTFNNLTITNATGISSIAGNVTVNNSLSLQGGKVAASNGSTNYIITVGTSSGGSVSRTSGWIYNGSLKQYFKNNGDTLNFPVGDASNYRPVGIKFNTVSSAGYLTVTQLTGPHPQISSAGINPVLTPYWNLTSSGVAGSYDATFTFVGGDGATATSVANEYTASNWVTSTAGTRTTTSNQVTGITTFGDFVFGTTTGVPLVTTQPSSVSICSTTTTTSFTAASTSNPTPTVKWQRSTDGTNWFDITANLDAGVTYSGFTTNTLTLTGSTTLSGQNGYKYRPIYTNLNGSSTNAVPGTLTVTPAPSATISYPGAPYGSTDNTSHAATISGTLGGTFTWNGVAANINSITGAITPNANTPNIYTVTYTIAASGGCSVFSTTTTVKITNAPTAIISYSGNPFCKSVTTAQSVTITGTGNYVNGTSTAYTAPIGLTIDGTTGAITPSTSTPGTYTVTYNIPADNPYPASTATTQVTVTAVPTASISYTGGPFCSTDQTPDAVTLTGTNAYTGGTFTASPSGLIIDAITGAITPFGSTVNTYTVTYTIPASGGCSSVTTTTSVQIVNRPTASLTYSGSPYCVSITSASPNLTGANNGSYGSTAGLVINASTGVINPSTSTPGDYVVTYTIPANGTCGIVQVTANVSIVATPTASISYSSSSYCQAGSVQSVTLNGTGNYTGGTFTSSPSGLTINSSTGDITPSSSNTGSYTITYTTPGCPVIATTTVDITAAPTASFSYPTSPYCQTDGSLEIPTFSGDNSGTFSAPAGLSIDPNSGGITPSTSTPGTYTVTYTIPAQGTCGQVVVTKSVTITAVPTANISYVGTPFCTSLSIAQSVTLSGTNAYTSGTFSAPGVTINSGTGAITPSTSIAGNYTITYMTPASGGCSAVSATTPITITTLPGATISYSAAAYCISDVNTYIVNYTATSGAYTGGTFSVSPATGLSIDASGTITPSTSTAGVYTVTYTIPASAGCSSVPVTTSVTINADATIALTSAGTTTSQTPCINTAIINITYSIGGGGTGATVSGLPSGVTGLYNSGTKIFTISGTPNVSGPFSYTVTTTGPCVNNALSGTINVNANSTITLTSAGTTTSQTPCINTAITNITYSVGGGGTGATFSGLPGGVTGSYSLGTVTISGIPNVSGNFNYTVTTTGPCVNTFLGGTINVKPDATITLTSAAATTIIKKTNNCASVPTVVVLSFASAIA